MLKAEFTDSVNTQIHPFYKEMVMNNTYDFAPVTPTRLYYAKDDELAPYSVSENTYNHMISLGADDVQLVNLGPNISHVGSIFSGTLLAKKWFDTLK